MAVCFSGAFLWPSGQLPAAEVGAKQWQDKDGRPGDPQTPHQLNRSLCLSCLLTCLFVSSTETSSTRQVTLSDLSTCLFTWIILRHLINPAGHFVWPITYLFTCVTTDTSSTQQGTLNYLLVPFSDMSPTQQVTLSHLLVTRLLVSSTDTLSAQQATLSDLLTVYFLVNLCHPQTPHQLSSSLRLTCLLVYLCYP